MNDTKTQCLLKLIAQLQVSRCGLTYEDIREEFGADLRTVRRWIHELKTTFPIEMRDLEAHSDGRKRWVFRPSAGSPLFTALTEEDLSTLDTAEKVFEQDGRADLARSIEHVRNLINAQIQRSKQPRSFLENVDALVEAEGLVMHPGPRVQIDSKVMEQLRYAILSFKRVRITYGTRGTRILEPYGFLYGQKHYLVAFLARKREPAPRLLILGDIHDPELLDETFDHRSDFDLKKYAEQSFGVYQGDPANVSLRFSPEVAEEASRFLFHPTQKMEFEDDGSLLVKFRASGQFEIACHLMSWEGKVKVIKPKALREIIITLAEQAANANRSRPRP